MLFGLDGVEIGLIIVFLCLFAGILSGFPVGALIFIQVAKPDYYDEVLDHPWFIPACFIVGIMLTLNIFVMRALVNIKV